MSSLWRTPGNARLVETEDADLLGMERICVMQWDFPVVTSLASMSGCCSE